jgi:hypothetical protein
MAVGAGLGCEAASDLDRFAGGQHVVERPRRVGRRRAGEELGGAGGGVLNAEVAVDDGDRVGCVAEDGVEGGADVVQPLARVDEFRSQVGGEPPGIGMRDGQLRSQRLRLDVAHRASLLLSG